MDVAVHPQGRLVPVVTGGLRGDDRQENVPALMTAPDALNAHEVRMQISEPGERRVQFRMLKVSVAAQA